MMYQDTKITQKPLDNFEENIHGLKSIMMNVLVFFPFILITHEDNMIILVESKIGMRDIIIGKRSNDVML